MGTRTDGYDAVFFMNTGTAADPVMTCVAGQRGLTINKATEEIDTTTKKDDRWQSRIPNTRSWGAEADSLIELDDAGFQQLEVAWLTNKIFRGEFERPDGSRWRGDVFLTDFPEEYPHDGEATMSVTLAGTGPLTPLPAPSLG